MEKEFFHTVERDTVYIECGCEHTLPDYQGEVKKILTNKAKVLLSGKYVNGGEVEYAGGVKFTVCYLDSENKLTTAEFSTDFEHSFPIEEADYVDSEIEARVVNYSVRPSGPRKFSAKATVGCRICVCEQARLRIEGVALEDESAQLLNGTVDIKRSVWGKSGEVEYADELGKIKDASVDEIEILSISAEGKVNEVRPAVGGVSAAGILEVVAIASIPAQPAFAIKKSIPFEEFIPMDTPEGDMGAVVRAEVLKAEASLVAEDDGAVSVGFVAEVEYTAGIDSNLPLTVVKDAYLTSAETVGSYSDFAYESFLGSKYVPVSLSLECSKMDCGCDGAHSVVSSNHSIRILDTEVCRDHVKISGETTFSGIACQINEEGKLEYCNYKFTSPFAESAKLDVLIPSGATASCVLCGATSSVTFDSTHAFGKCEATIFVSISAPFVERVLTSVEKTEDLAPAFGGANVSVCFPDKEDTLWDIAKRYHTTVRDIAVNNSLTEETVASASSSNGLRGVKKLMIL